MQTIFAAFGQEVLYTVGTRHPEVEGDGKIFGIKFFPDGTHESDQGDAVAYGQGFLKDSTAEFRGTGYEAGIGCIARGIVHRKVKGVVGDQAGGRLAIQLPYAKEVYENEVVFHA